MGSACRAPAGTRPDAGGAAARNLATDFEDRAVPAVQGGRYSLDFYTPNIDPRAAD